MYLKRPSTCAFGQALEGQRLNLLPMENQKLVYTPHPVHLLWYAHAAIKFSYLILQKHHKLCLPQPENDRQKILTLP
jgi:hypothetical protein